jgi:2-C-methyl-D-erythritol 4-phosphate cytidylyltransferase
LPLVVYHMKVFAIITAAGSGSRFSSGKNRIPKQFIKLYGKPVILYSLEAFQKSKHIDEIFVSANYKYFDFLHSLAVKNKITKLTTLVEGGKTRFESVRNTFLQVEGKPGDLVLIHDAARPNINNKLIEKLLAPAVKYGEVVPGIKISETVKKEKAGIITGTVDRNNLWTVQTPQVFRYGVLRKSYKKAGGKNDFTDEAALAEHAGYKVRLIEGTRNNIKITTGEDLRTLKKIMLVHSK